MNFDYYRRSLEEWRNARQANVQIRAKLGLDMIPPGGKGNSLLLLRNSELQLRLARKNSRGKLSGHRISRHRIIFIRSRRWQTWTSPWEGGAIIDLQNYEIFKEFRTSVGLENFGQPANQWAIDFEARVEESSLLPFHHNTTTNASEKGRTRSESFSIPILSCQFQKRNARRTSSIDIFWDEQHC